MEGVRWWVALVVLVGVAGEKWRWPDERSATLKIDTKVRLIDDYRNNKRNEIDSSQAEDDSFREPLDTTGFYNRPQNDGRYPVKIESPLFDNGIKFKKTDLFSQPGHVDLHRHNADSNMDFVRYCKCLDTAECRKNNFDIVRSCDSGKVLCCYLQPNRQLGKSSEFFNEAEDERPDILLPGRSHPGGPFPPPPLYDSTTITTRPRPLIVGPGIPNASGSSSGSENDDRRLPPILVGPSGPTGAIGPTDDSAEFGRNRNRPVLVGPNGPSGIIGPTHIHHKRPHTYPEGHRGHIEHHEPHETAQRGVLVGPGGPTGILGPPGYARQPLLVGPGGPTGLIGPPNYRNRQPNRYNNYPSRGILTGPQGPTGIVGPGQQILVGPGGPTGRIGPTRSSFF